MIVVPECSFPGIQKPLDQYGPEAADASDSAPAKDAEDAGEDDDDDFDLFGSDDEEAVGSYQCPVK